MSSFVWTAYECRPGDYNELVRKIWIRSFGGSEILEPFEDLEMRFKLVSLNYLSKTSEDKTRMDSSSIR